MEPVYPDVVIHWRKGPDGEKRPEGDEDNLLVVETKTKIDSASDIEKIEAFRDELGYQYGLFIDFQSNDSFRNEDRHWRSEEE